MKRKNSRRSWLPLALLALAACTSTDATQAASRGASASEDTSTAALESSSQQLWLATALGSTPVQKWPAGPFGVTWIRVCFAQSAKNTCNAPACNFTNRQAVIQAALNRAWGHYALLGFFDFGMCTTSVGVDNPADALVITGDANAVAGRCNNNATCDTGETQSACPNDCGCGGPGGACNLGAHGTYDATTKTFLNTRCGLSFQADWCDDVPAANSANSVGAWESTIIHEVGHALGFHHEQDRPENFDANSRPLFCLDGANRFTFNAPAPGNNAAPLTNYYDAFSVMNYCAVNVTGWTGGPFLYGRNTFMSQGDLQGAASYYGAQISVRWLKAAPGIAHLLNL